ncbi:unnamed protein product [Closterium sp. NIES-53]
MQLQPQQERAEEEPQERQQGQVPSQQTPEEAERQRLRLCNLLDPAPARLVRGPLPSPPVPPVQSLSSSQWTCRSPLGRYVSPEPRRSRYRADGPFHLLVSGPARSPSSGGAPVFPLEVLEDTHVLASFVAPGRYRPSHWYAAKRVAKYVASTSGMGIVLGGKQPVTLIGFLDSAWADDAELLRSTQGYCFSLGTGAVSWRSTRASSVSSSSYEAEVYAAAMAAQELCWLNFLLTNLGERPRSPPVLFADNRSTVLLCEEPRLVGKAKHIQLCYFLLREL